MKHYINSVIEGLYETLFRKNEDSVKSYIEECLKKYSVKLLGTILAKRYSYDARYFDTKFNASEARSFVLQDMQLSVDCADYGLNGKRRIGSSTVANRYSRLTSFDNRKKDIAFSTLKDTFYMRTLFDNIIGPYGQDTKKYFSSIATYGEKELQWLEYYDQDFAEGLLSKIKDDAKDSLNFLPPAIIQYPESKYTSMLDSNEKTHPKYIINIG